MSSSPSISITKWSSAHDVRFRKAQVTSRTRSASIVGSISRVSLGQLLSIQSGKEAAVLSVKSSQKWLCTILIRPCFSEIFPWSPILQFFSAPVLLFSAEGPQGVTARTHLNCFFASEDRAITPGLLSCSEQRNCQGFSFDSIFLTFTFCVQPRDFIPHFKIITGACVFADAHFITDCAIAFVMVSNNRRSPLGKFNLRSVGPQAICVFQDGAGQSLQYRCWH